jgi:hypothetical protein
MQNDWKEERKEAARQRRMQNQVMKAAEAASDERRESWRVARADAY